MEKFSSRKIVYHADYLKNNTANLQEGKVIILVYSFIYKNMGQ